MIGGRAFRKPLAVRLQKPCHRSFVEFIKHM